MTHSTTNLTKALIFSATAGLLALGAASAYAIDDAARDVADAPQGQVWVHEKTAVSENPPIIRIVEPLPELVVPMNTDFRVDARSTPIQADVQTYARDTDLREFDLVEDSPLFIGAKGATEFDTRDAQTDSGSYPRTMDIDPLYTVAGAGLSTSF